MNTLNRWYSAFLIVLTLFACQKKQAVETEPIMNDTFELLVGTYTNADSEGIYRVSLASDGELMDKTLLVTSEQPSFVASNDDGSIVAAVNENLEGGISFYKWNQDKSSLELTAELPTEGAHPCHVEFSKNNDLVVAANYSSGNVIGYRIDESDAIDTVAIIRQHEGTGPDTTRQEGPHAHYSTFSPDGKFLYAVDLGIDKVIAYPVLGDSLGAASVALELDPGDGPRHLAFHPQKDIVYVISELTSSIMSAKVDKSTGAFERIAKVSTLPEDFDGTSYCAAIKVSSDGKFLYASNRGHNSIAIFSVDETGGLSLLGTESVQGDWPRDFSLSPDERFIVIANQKSDNIVVLERNTETGMLSYSGKQMAISMPVNIVF